MKCEDCEIQEAEIICIECEELFCLSCDASIHKGGKRKSHSRLTVCSNCKSPAEQECKDCHTRNCTNCKHFHKGHHIISLTLPKSLGVFWDVSYLTSRKVSIISALAEITSRIAKPRFVKLYSDNWARALIPDDADVVFRYGISPLDALFLDLSMLAYTGLTHILIVAPQAFELSNKLGYLKTTSTKIILATSVEPLSFYEISQDLNENFPQQSHSESILPLYRPKHLNKSIEVELLYNYLLQLADSGTIIIEKTELIEKFSNRQKFSYEKSSYILDLSIKKSLINELTFNYPHKSYVMYSIKIPNPLLSDISFSEYHDFTIKNQASVTIFKAIKWVLASLKTDEISSVKKNVKFRLKKIFGLDLPDKIWEIASKSAHKHPRSSSESLKGTNFRLRKVKKKLYINGEYWQGLETLKNDSFTIRNSDYWDDFLSFFEKYFASNYKKRIPMGRYGCGLLLKLSGPDSLRSLSIGKLIYMSTFAIQDDYFYYHNKGLVWTKDFKLLDKCALQKLEDLKKHILLLLSQHPQGLNLSNLGLLLKAKFNLCLNFQSFGYKKLKDFLTSFSEIMVNSDIVSIKTNPVFDKDKLAEIITEIVKEKDYGITGSILQATLQVRVNQSIDWTMYNVSSCEEFIKQYTKSSIEVLKTPECNILYKANEYRTYSYFFPFKSLFNSAMLECSRVPTPQIYHPISHSVDLSKAPRKSINAPMQRMINISNVPSEMIQKSPFRDSEAEEAQFVEPFVIEDLSVVMDDKSNGFRSIQHSKDSSLADWHFRTSSMGYSGSKDPSNAVAYALKPNNGLHSRLNFSWADKPFGLE